MIEEWSTMNSYGNQIQAITVQKAVRIFKYQSFSQKLNALSVMLRTTTDDRCIEIYSVLVGMDAGITPLLTLFTNNL